MKSLLFWLAVAALPPAHSENIRVVTETSSYAYLRGGKVAGPATEIVEQSLRKAGLNDYQIRLYPWARSYDMALKEANVLIYVIARTPERENSFKWAGEFTKIRYHLYKLRERPQIVVRSLADARRYSVGVMRDDVRHQYLKKAGFSKLVVSAQSLDNFQKLLNRQVDLLPLNDDDPAALCAEAHYDCARLEKVLTLDDMSSGLYMAYSLATPDAIVERTRAAFEKIKAEGGVKKLMDK